MRSSTGGIYNDRVRGPRIDGAGWLVAALIWASPLRGATPAVEFNRDVRPILSDRCFACHGPDRASRTSPLRLDQEQSARAALSPGDPEHSLLYQRITSTGEPRRVRMA